MLQKGFINSRFKTVQKNIRVTTGERKQKVKRSISSSSESQAELIAPQQFNLTVLKNQYKDDIEFLNNCPASESSAILERMKRTYPMRLAIITSEEKSSLWDIFPCYFTTADIVSLSLMSLTTIALIIEI